MTTSVLIVGAGITGLSTAIWLQRAGASVTLVDPVVPGEPGQASFGNGGILASSSVVPVSVPGLWRSAPGLLLDPDSPLFLRWSYLPRLMPWLVPFLRNGSAARLKHIVAALEPLTRDSVDQHRTLARGTGAERHIALGHYGYLYRDAAARDRDAFGLGLRKAHGFAHETRDRAALVNDDPHLGEVYGAAAIFPDHGWITDPPAYLKALARHVAREGGTIRQARAVDIGDGEVTLEGGERLIADRVVLAAGVWSKALAERIGHRVIMESERGYHLELTGTNLAPPFPYMLADAKFVVTPMEHAIRCAGLLEFGGLEAGPSEKPVALLKRRVRRLYPGLTWTGENAWMGHRPATADSLPLVGRAPASPRTVFAFGSHHIGLTIGPRLGRMVADLVLDRPGNLDLAPYAADRFDRRRQG